MKRRKKKKSSFIKRNRISIVILGVLFTYLSITMINQEIKLNELRKEEKQVLEEVKKLKKEISEMENKIEQSQSPEFVEKIAREKLKMVKPNEIIYILQDKMKSD